MQVVMGQQQVPASQVEEGLQHIYLGVIEICRLIPGFEDFAETLDGINNAVNGMVTTVGNIGMA
eukprot:2588413-Pyramimonas_sp.AAC.1